MKVNIKTIIGVLIVFSVLFGAYQIHKNANAELHRAVTEGM